MKPPKAAENPLAEMFSSIALLPELFETLSTLKRGIAEIHAEIQRLETREPQLGWMDAKAAAQYMGISAGTFEKYRYMTKVKIPCHALDGKSLFKASELDTYIRLYQLKSSGLA